MKKQLFLLIITFMMVMCFSCATTQQETADIIADNIIEETENTEADMNETETAESNETEDDTVNLVFTHQVNDEIPAETREKVVPQLEKALETISAGDFAGFKTVLTPHLKDNYSDVLDQLFPQLQGLMSLDTELLFHYYNTYITDKEINQQVTAPVFTTQQDLDTFIIPQFIFYSSRVHNMFYINKGDGLNYLLFISFIDVAGEWLINAIHLGNYGINDQNGPELLGKAEQFYEKGELFSSYAYAQSAYTYLNPFQGIGYENEEVNKKRVLEITDELNKSLTVPYLLPNQTELYGFIIRVITEGIVPEILYTTSYDFNQTEEIETQAQGTIDQIYKLFPDFKTNFDLIIMTAYNEPPIDNQKQYQVYRTIIKNE